MTKLDCKIKMKLVPEGKIIAYKTDKFISPKEFDLLSKKLRDKFEPIHEIIKFKYIKG